MNLSVGFMKKSWEKENQIVIPLMTNPGDISFQRAGQLNYLVKELLQKWQNPVLKC